MTHVRYCRLIVLSLCCMMVMSLINGNVIANEAPLTPALSDRLEVSLNNGPKQLMTLYTNAMYEITLENVKGNATYTLFYNGEEYATNSLITDVVTDVHVRFTPFKTTVVTDSWNHPQYFPVPATWVGNFTELNDYLEVPLQYWNPADNNANLNYLGGGTYGRTFTFTEPLPHDVNIAYKISLGGSWNSGFGDIGNNGDIHITIPQGSESITLWADALSMVCIDSISADPFIIWEDGVPLYTAPAATVDIALATSFTAWQPLSVPFKQVAPTVYAFTQEIAAGNHQYQFIFNTTIDSHVRDLKVTVPTPVIFVYEVTEGKVYDSINNTDEVIELLNLQRQLTWQELEQMVYDGNDLGVTYTAQETTFKVWAPSASAVELKLYATGSDDEPGAKDLATHPMIASTNGDGIWSITLDDDDYHGIYYTYSITVNSRTNEVVDLYAKATGVNGNRGMVIDLATTNPTGWHNDQHVTVEQVTDAIIWELHVRDFSMSPDSGISEENRGKYLAFTENGTTVNSAGEIPTGMDYIKDLGVNYVHLLPVFDHDNDETSNTYNWGYNPKNYNVPEGQYSSNPWDGSVRINEFKQMVMAFHDANIGVVMDVVYNHTGPTHDSWFHLTVPNYYYRMTDSGAFYNCSGCGNVTASERFMMRKYMIDSILHWVKEYHIDGFRFDLMGLHDVETMNAIRQALNDEGYEDIIIYGEPWDMGIAPLPNGQYYATQENADMLMDGILLFNDYFRDAAKGFVFDSTGTGFLQGGQGKPSGYTNNDLMGGMLASSKASDIHFTEDPPYLWSMKPSQTVTYISCHDNATLWDRLIESVYGIPSDEEKESYHEYDENLVAMNKMAATLTFTSQGMSLIHAGEEVARTKLGDHNSYQSPDEINQLIWSKADTFADLHAYYKGMIEIKKAYAPFRDMTNKTILNGIHISQTNEPYVLSYTIQDVIGAGGWDTVAVLYNSSLEEKTITLETANGDVPEEWVMIANKEAAGVEELDTVSGMDITIPPQTSLILVDRMSFERDPNDTIEKEIPVKEIILTVEKNTLEVGESTQMLASFIPQNATVGNSITSYSTSNHQVATVNSLGQVTAIAPGIVTIFAENENGIRGQYQITVIASNQDSEIDVDTEIEHIGVDDNNISPPSSRPETYDISSIKNLFIMLIITTIFTSMTLRKKKIN